MEDHRAKVTIEPPLVNLDTKPLKPTTAYEGAYTVRISYESILEGGKSWVGLKTKHEFEFPLVSWYFHQIALQRPLKYC